MAKRRGAPKGNQNARKSGMYGSVLSLDEQTELAIWAGSSAGVDEEIALLKLLIRRTVKESGLDPAPMLEAVSRGIDSLGRALKVQRAVSGQAAHSLEAALSQALDAISDELGIPL